MMTEQEQKLYDAIMQGGYSTIKTDKIMIVGDLEILKNILELPAPVRRKSREEHLAEVGEDAVD